MTAEQAERMEEHELLLHLAALKYETAQVKHSDTKAALLVQQCVILQELASRY